MKTSKVKELTPHAIFHYWIAERLKILERKRLCEPKPWTDDVILQSYRFCNVRREDDTVTEWVRVNWRNPNIKDKDLFFAMIVARLFNLPETLQAIGYPVPWNLKSNRVGRILRQRRQAGFKVFNAAYIVSTNGISTDKVDYLLDHVLQPAWQQRESLRPKAGDTLNEFHSRLIQCNGLGSFIAAQVIADTKHCAKLRKAADWLSFAASGPGSRRGLNRLLGRPHNAAWTEKAWRTAFAPVAAMCYRHYSIDAQDTQNCLCEYDKYCRVLHGQGRPKRKYPGA